MVKQALDDPTQLNITYAFVAKLGSETVVIDIDEIEDDLSEYGFDELFEKYLLDAWTESDSGIIKQTDFEKRFYEAFEEWVTAIVNNQIPGAEKPKEFKPVFIIELTENRDDIVIKPEEINYSSSVEDKLSKANFSLRETLGSEIVPFRDDINKEEISDLALKHTKRYQKWWIEYLEYKDELEESEERYDDVEDITFLELDEIECSPEVLFYRFRVNFEKLKGMVISADEKLAMIEGFIEDMQSNLDN